MQVEFEDLLQQVRRHDLLLQFSRRSRLFSRLLRLLFQFDTFQLQQVLGALDWIFQGAVSVVEPGTLLQTPGALLIISLSEKVWMKLSAQRIELLFQTGCVQVELAGKAKEGEIVDRRRRLYLAAGCAEGHCAHGA